MDGVLGHLVDECAADLGHGLEIVGQVLSVRAEVLATSVAGLESALGFGML